MIQLLRIGTIMLCMTAALLSLSVDVLAQNQLKENARSAKISTDLLNIATSNGFQAPNSDAPRTSLFVYNGKTIAIDALANSEAEGQALLQSLQALGLTRGIVSKHRVYGFLPINRLEELKNIPTLRIAMPAYKPMHNAGLVTSQGDVAMRSDIARTTHSVNGNGVKVGIISDSYDKLGGAASGVLSGDLPAGVQVLQEFSGSAADVSDEGRGMAEIIHDVAPGAALAFHTAFDGYLDFAQGIRDLAAAGCKVIVDDIFYFAEPYFQDGPIAQAVDDVVNNNGVTYFSSAGNHARNSYQNTYNNTPFVGPFGPGDSYMGAHNFSGGDVYQSVTVPAGSQIYVGLQWDNPFASVTGSMGAQTDLDLLVYRSGAFQSGLSGLTFNINGDPIEIAVLYNPSASPVTFELVVARYAGPNPTLIKWVAFTNGYTITTEYNTKSSTLVGHANSTRCIATGAAPFYNTPAFNSSLTTATLEYFSSAGGTPILFAIDGTRLGSPITRPKPEITAVDAGNTTFFGEDIPQDSDSYPNFFGTSASAPHAAAVAALMVQKVPSISSATILSTLQNTSLDMNDPATDGFDIGFDYGTGHGFIQADRALQAISNSNDFAITGVTTVSCTTISAGQRRLTFNPVYLGVSGQPISFSVVNEMLPTTAAGPYTLDLYADNPVIVLKAAQTGSLSTASYNYNWLGACGGPTPPPSGNFAIIGVTTVSCQSVTAGIRTVSFNPQYSGVNGQPISFSVTNEMLPTTAAGPYTLNLYTDNPIITLKAQQTGSPADASYTYNWLASCGSSTNGARVSANAELILSVRILGNPVLGETAEIEIKGADGKPVGLNLVDITGRLIHEHRISEATQLEHVRIPLTGKQGVLLLTVTTPTEHKVIKLIKQ
ncbi:T9SS type A sorting domain-containing protein [Spirosoma daeguense]